MPGLAARSAQAIERFNALIDGLREMAASHPVADLAEAVLDRTGYQTALAESNDLQDASRVENLQELVSVAREFDGQNEEGRWPTSSSRCRWSPTRTRSRTGPTTAAWSP